MTTRDLETTKIALFKGKKIRKTIHNDEWWFVVEDVVLALIDSSDPKQYIQRMKLRDPELNKGWVQIVHTLEVETTGGGQKMLCANTEGMFRIIQSIPSPKAEPLKRWLAQEKPDTFPKNKTVAKRGGRVAGNARTETEKEIGRSVVSKENYLQTPESQKQLKAEK